MCILGPSLYIRYGSIYIMYPYMLYICNIIHLTSTWSFPAVDVNGRPNPPDLVIMVQRQSVSYALKLCILESEVPEVFCGRTTTLADRFCWENSPWYKACKSVSSGTAWIIRIYIILKGSTPNSLFSLWKRPLQRKKQPMDLGKTLHPLPHHLDTIQGATLLMGKVFGHPTNMPF